MFINPINVFIHLEQFNKRYGLLHIGISFENNYKILRYDFKKDGENYLTVSKLKFIPDSIMYLNGEFIVDDYIPETYDILKSRYNKNVEVETVTIPWGITNYSFKEIEEFEESLHMKYILGIYDCRHYVRRFTKWATCKATPVWKLHLLWKENYVGIN
jgi:hypothetical protein